MIGQAQIDAMPRGSVLVNCARGALVDYDAVATPWTPAVWPQPASTCSPSSPYRRARVCCPRRASSSPRTSPARA
ncbi:hypothetical protein LT493_12275 [Streptomyces tricolor]|nr:hypothetical protein [Streptomyces tricolor]